MDEVLAFFKENPAYHLATVDEQGNPQIRPFGTFAQINGAIYIQTGKCKKVYQELVAHPTIAICGLSAKGDQWVRVNATAVEFDDLATRTEMLDQYPSLKPLYAPDDGNCVVFRLENATATFCSFTAAPHTVEF